MLRILATKMVEFARMLWITSLLFSFYYYYDVWKGTLLYGKLIFVYVDLYIGKILYWLELFYVDEHPILWHSLSYFSFFCRIRHIILMNWTGKVVCINKIINTLNKWDICLKMDEICYSEKLFMLRANTI